MQIESHFSLRGLNTFGMDNQARYFARPSSAAEFRELLFSEQFHQMEKMILGGGSNVLLTRDINGLVLKNDIKGIHKTREDPDHVWIKAGAGEPWHPFVRHCIDLNLAGIENLSLIPGSVGAAPMQNIGAYGVEIKDVFEELEAMDTQTGEVIIFPLRDCGFGYRESVFKHQLRGRFIILSVTLKLSRVPDFNIAYGVLAAELQSMGVKDLTLDAVSQAVMSIRRSKLPDPEITGNAGSFFKNPELTLEKLESLKKAFTGLPVYPLSEGGAKVPAAWLIEQCGWKGYRQGDAGVHPQQALVLVNYGHASGADILDLAGRVTQSVEEKFGIHLVPEINII